MKKLALILSCLLLFAACAKTNPYVKGIQDDGTLRVGVKTDVQNFGYQNPETGEFEGLEIDIARYIAKAILGDDQAIHFVPVTAQTRDPALRNGEIDLVIATFTINEERKAAYNFSQPYYTDEIGFLVRKADNITSLEQLRGKRIGTTRSSTAFTAFSTDTPLFDGDYTLIDFANYPEMKNALLLGTIDVFVTDISILRGYLDEQTFMLDEGISPQPYGIATRLDELELAEYIDGLLEKMISDGTLAEYLKKWKLDR